MEEEITVGFLLPRDLALLGLAVFVGAPKLSHETCRGGNYNKVACYQIAFFFFFFSCVGARLCTYMDV